MIKIYKLADGKYLVGTESGWYFSPTTLRAYNDIKWVHANCVMNKEQAEYLFNLLERCPNRS